MPFRGARHTFNRSALAAKTRPSIQRSLTGTADPAPLVLWDALMIGVSDSIPTKQFLGRRNWRALAFGRIEVQAGHRRESKWTKTLGFPWVYEGKPESLFEMDCIGAVHAIHSDAGAEGVFDGNAVIRTDEP